MGPLLSFCGTISMGFLLNFCGTISTEFLLNFCGTISMGFLLNFCGTISTDSTYCYGAYRRPFLLLTHSFTSQLFVAFAFGTEENSKKYTLIDYCYPNRNLCGHIKANFLSIVILPDIILSCEHKINVWKFKCGLPHIS